MIVSAHFSNKNAFLSIILYIQSNLISVLKLKEWWMGNVKSLSVGESYPIKSDIYQELGKK